MGVGDSTASPTAALLLSILQESAGRIATILFAHRFGTALEPECKMYRLLADVLNDFAFVLDCLSPTFPKPIRILVLSLSSILRALCGVAAGSAKASLSAHFARWGNLGELNAKDSSQETVISLLGMLAGSVVVSWVTSPVATWTALILLLSIHLETNRRAVRAVSMRTINRQRANLIYRQLISDHVPTPKEISQVEHIFARNGDLCSNHAGSQGHCQIGVPFKEMLGDISDQYHRHTASASVKTETLETILEIYSKRSYVLWCRHSGNSPSFAIVVKSGATCSDLLTAWWQALLLAGHTKWRAEHRSTKDQPVEILRETAISASNLLERYEKQLVEAGWDLNTNALETGSSSRLATRD